MSPWVLPLAIPAGILLFIVNMAISERDEESGQVRAVAIACSAAAAHGNLDGVRH